MDSHRRMRLSALTEIRAQFKPGYKPLIPVQVELDDARRFVKKYNTNVWKAVLSTLRAWDSVVW